MHLVRIRCGKDDDISSKWELIVAFTSRSRVYRHWFLGDVVALRFAERRHPSGNLEVSKNIWEPVRGQD